MDTAGWRKGLSRDNNGFEQMTSSSPALPERLDAPTAVPASRRILMAGAELMALVGSWEWIPATGELRWSDNLFRLFGLEPGEVTPSTDLVLRLTHPDDTQRVVGYIDAMAKQGTGAPIEYRIIPRGRGVRHLRSTVAAVETNGAAPRMIVGCVQDVTDHHCAERENASRFAVSSALAEWQTFEQGAEGLLRRLAGAIGAEEAALWLPDGDLLVASVFWIQEQDPVGPSAFEATRRQLRLPSGVGLPGRVWESKTPMNKTNRTKKRNNNMARICSPVDRHRPHVHARPVVAVEDDRLAVGRDVGAHFVARQAGQPMLVTAVGGHRPEVEPTGGGLPLEEDACATVVPARGGSRRCRCSRCCAVRSRPRSSHRSASAPPGRRRRRSDAGPGRPWRLRREPGSSVSLRSLSPSGDITYTSSFPSRRDWNSTWLTPSRRSSAPAAPHGERRDHRASGCHGRDCQSQPSPSPWISSLAFTSSTWGDPVPPGPVQAGPTPVT